MAKKFLLLNGCSDTISDRNMEIIRWTRTNYGNGKDYMVINMKDLKVGDYAIRYSNEPSMVVEITDEDKHWESGDMRYYYKKFNIPLKR